MNLIKLINEISKLKWDNIETDKQRNGNNIANLRIILDGIYDLNKRIKSICNLNSIHESNLNLTSYRHHVERIDACITSINYKFFKDREGLRSLVLSITDITSHPSIPDKASKVNTLNGLTQHHVNNVKTYYNALKANSKFSSTTDYSNYLQVLEIVDRRFICLWEALLENKKKYLIQPMTSYISEALSFYTNLVLHNDLEVLKAIAKNEVNLPLASTTISDHVKSVLPKLQSEVCELLKHHNERTHEYNNINNIFRIGYSKTQKISALEKLNKLINHKKNNYDSSFSAYKLNEEDKSILKNGKTGQTLDSLAVRYGLANLDNLLALLNEKALN
ncbi:hypothetical protein IB642_05460 [Allofrancisella guangzhouensis]|uniref:Uncharacterized protein n=1 Tax=Allofrancisella guangzhouensis TaxID=594679 RepID=A0A0A8E5Y3_9GAMM|nr:hypothetical protein [Allofrancisella guangzhouensis]AJC49007.1 hypothetical protein SD28_04830 [Allofrancisella guangzhouensis]MBK2044467.1 hypothetical protein [Allofrancisella guangzhouensis]MBK2046104.1 hypothetical protein [Allofrancisella guangzhouensis]